MITFVDAETKHRRTTGVIPIHREAGFEGMRKAGRLTAKALDLLVDDAELATRRQGWTPNPPRYTSGVLGKYARLVQGAETGAITNPL